MKLELLSDNMVLILEYMMNNQNLCKLINYDEKNPIEKTNLLLPASGLLFTKLFPYPFNPEVIREDCTQINVWCPQGEFDDSGSISIADVVIDIVVAKSLFLINIDGRPKLRPYETMKEVIKTFKGQSIGTLGKLKFQSFMHITANELFDVFRLRTNMMMLS